MKSIARVFLAAGIALATLAGPRLAAVESVLFIGNSFMYGAGSPVRFYRPQTVTDLNREGVGGVPALFKAFADQASRDFAVSHELVGGTNIDYHLQNRRAVIDRNWDHVVMAGYSTLDKEKPGDPGLLVR